MVVTSIGKGRSENLNQVSASTNFKIMADAETETEIYLGYVIRNVVTE